MQIYFDIGPFRTKKSTHAHRIPLSVYLLRRSFHYRRHCPILTLCGSRYLLEGRTTVERELYDRPSIMFIVRYVHALNVYINK